MSLHQVHLKKAMKKGGYFYGRSFPRGMVTSVTIGKHTEVMLYVFEVGEPGKIFVGTALEAGRWLQQRYPFFPPGLWVGGGLVINDRDRFWTDPLIQIAKTRGGSFTVRTAPFGRFYPEAAR